MRFTSKSNIERIIEIYSRNNTKDADKMKNFINSNQSKNLKQEPKKETLLDADADADVKPACGTISYEEMKKIKEEEKERQKKLKQQKNNHNIVLKTNKFFEQNRQLNEKAKVLLKDDKVRTYFRGTSQNILFGNT